MENLHVKCVCEADVVKTIFVVFRSSSSSLKFINKCTNLASTLTLTLNPSPSPGCLPPLQESYQVHTATEVAAMMQEYIELATALAPLIDIFLCETMSSIAQAVTAATAAATAAASAGSSKKKHIPVWVAFTLQDSTAAKLRSGESLVDAVRAVREMVPAVEVVLLNCCAPQAVSAGLIALRENTKNIKPPLRVGGYCNGFATSTSEWLLSSGEHELIGNGDDAMAELPAEEYDAETGILLPSAFVKHAQRWIEQGNAMVVGGCCGIGPDHIRELVVVAAAAARCKKWSSSLLSP